MTDRRENPPPTHWTDAQRWRALSTHEIVTARELLSRHGTYLHSVGIRLIDMSSEHGIRMPDGETWYRYL